jgi:hypothetical protein
MPEQNKPGSTRGDEPGTKQQQGSPGQQPQKPMGQPDKTEPNRGADQEQQKDQPGQVKNPNRTP